MTFSSTKACAERSAPRPHPRTVGWFGTVAVAMGGINQSLFLLSALLIGQGAIPGQGSAAVVLLGVGLLLSWAATPGWTELVLMYPHRVGGIAATCAEAFRPYSPVLANLTGVCYWWGWVPTCGVTALLSASAIHQWYLPSCPVSLLACGIVLFFAGVNLCGVKWVMRFSMPIATGSAVLAFLSALIPAVKGTVDWHRAFDFHLVVPFPGWFGQLTSVMAGLYLVGFAAPAFEQAACHVGETIDPARNVPRAMFVSAALASLYFIVLPVVWLGALGPEALAGDLAMELGPTFAPLLGGAAKAAAVWFMIFNMLHGTVAPLAGASRTLAQLSEDGLLPEFLALRSRTDAPWAATLLTAGMSIGFLLIGDPVWLIAAANLTYLIGIGLPNVAVWLLRRNEPSMERPYRAPRGTIVLGLVAAGVWALTAILGFQQFGLRTVLVGIAFAHSGAALYAWRKFVDRRRAGLPGVARTLHLKLTGAMLLVLTVDGAGYLTAVEHISRDQQALVVVLEDIFVVVALLRVGVGLIMPGMVAHSAVAVSRAADNLVKGTLADFTRAMQALAAGNLDAAKARFTPTPVEVRSRDELGDMARSFNRLQDEIGSAAEGLEGARTGLLDARRGLTEANERARLAERRYAEQQIEQLRNEHAIVLDSVGEGIHWINRDGCIRFENPAATTMLGYDATELIGLPAHATMHHSHSDGRAYAQNECPIYATLRDGQPRRVKDETFWRKDGTGFPVDYSATPIRDEHGQLSGAVVVFTDITERKKVEEAMRAVHQQLVETSRKAGMAEVATSVLHNVGNVLNSVNVSASCLADELRKSKLSSLTRMAAILQPYEGNAGVFFTADPRANKLPGFMTQLAGHLEAERAASLLELAHLQSSVDHIKEIVAMQQTYGRVSGATETVQIADLVEDTLRMEAENLTRHSCRVERDFASVPMITVDKHKVLQILVNLVRNAKDACTAAGRPESTLTLRIYNGNGRVKVAVSDDGIGIPQENLTRIFSYGFTTKKDGHGFGLQSGALAAKELGGELRVESVGSGHGATFTLELPVSAA